MKKRRKTIEKDDEGRKAASLPGLTDLADRFHCHSPPPKWPESNHRGWSN